MDNSIKTTLVTPTRRLATSLKKQILSSRFQQGIKVSNTPLIFALEDWLDHLWDTLRYAYPDFVLPIRLNTWQELIIWQQILKHSDKPLLRPSETAHTLKQAWQLMHAWCIDTQQILPLANEDVRAFCEWAEQFTHYCDKKNFISRALLPRFLKNHAEKIAKVIKSPVVFLGFDEIVPHIKKLILALQKQNIEVREEKGFLPEQANVTAYSFLDKEQEYYAAALWAKEYITKFPEGNIAIVVPELAKEWALVDRLFTQVFVPQSLLTSCHDIEKPYNISSGHPLSSLNIIKAAFVIINTILYPTKAEEWSQVLCSSYLKGALIEQTVRARFDRILQEIGKPSWRFSDILYEAKKFTTHEYNAMSLLVAQLEAVRGIKNKGKCYPSEWAEVFSIWLNHMGWPGDRELDSQEYQAMQRWFALLNEMSTLDVVIDQLWEAGDALHYLHRQAANTLFQIESNDKPLQILGILEAAGQLFSALWITSLNDNVWPASPNPNPFLPQSLQREKNMPHASAECELSFAREIFERLLHSANQIIGSFPQQQEDLVLFPSALLDRFLVQARDSLYTRDFWSSVYQKDFSVKNALEYYEDNYAPLVDKTKYIHGGSQLLKLQAECPFRAFAVLRCGIEDWPQSGFGLTALQRGSVLHACLEWIWKKITSWEVLQSLNEEEINQYIEEAIDYALREVNIALESLGEVYREIETKRLQQLILEWIALEKEREPFVVEAIEEQRQINLAGINLKLRIDRRDKLFSGGSVIIDYKTGNSNILHWNGERPDAPQLPLYAITQPDCVGVAFAQIQTNAVGWEGITAQENVLCDVNSVEKLNKTWDVETWDELLTSWKNILEKLVDDFVNGHAAVDPKYKEQTCQYCDFKSFCRVNG